MLKVLVVDDEQRQVKALSNVIRSLRPDYEVLEAFDGSEALMICQRETIFLMFTDIRMRTMDGLELVSHVVPNNPAMSIVIVSGFEEFNYAKSALKMGVMDYLVKPFEKSVIEKVLQGAEEKLNDRLEVEHSAYLSGVLLPKGSPFELIPKDTEGAVLLVAWNSEVEAISNYEVQIRKIIRELLRPYGISVCSRLDYQIDTIAVSLFSNKLSLSLSGICKILLDELRRRFEIEFAVASGSATSSPRGNAPEALRFTIEALSYLFYGGFGRVYVLTELQVRLDRGQLVDEGSIYEHIRQLNEREAIDAIDKYMSEKLKTGWILPSDIKSDALRLAGGILNIVISRGVDMPSLNILEDHRQAIEKAKNIDELGFKLRSMIRNAMVILSDDRRSGLIVIKCLSYIEQNYMRAITQEQVARHFHFNPSYFSIVFKSVMGVGFSEYIQKFRIEQAKKLLMTTDQKVYDIAVKVGYKDASHFIRSFRREVGISPDKYRKVAVTGEVRK